MTFFGRFRGGKKSADSGKTKDASQKPAPEPYRHIPTHAAIDALGGAPAGRNAADRAAIKAAHHKRNSEMSRHSSNLSTIVSVTPVSPLHGVYNGSTLQSTYSPMGLDQRRARSQTSFNSLQALTVPEGHIAQHSQPSSQEYIPGHNPENSASSSESSYIEIPYGQSTKQFDSHSSIPKANSPRKRKLGEAPRLSAPPKPASVVIKSGHTAGLKAPSETYKQRRHWAPFSRASRTVIMAH